MPVTTSNTIKLSDICLELYGSSSTSGRSLMQCHTDATGTFHPDYSVTGNTLLDFRGYPYTAGTAWRAIDPYCVQDDGYEFIFATNSQAPNYCLDRFRLIQGNFPTAEIQLRKPDGTVVDTQLFRDVDNPWTGFNTYDHTFMFDLSSNTSGEDWEFYLKNPSNYKFDQLYADINNSAGTAIRYPSSGSDGDPEATGMTTAQITVINFNTLKFDYNFPSNTTSYVIVHNQNIHTILGADKFYGHRLYIDGNPNITSNDIDQLIIGIDAIGRTGGLLEIDAGKRTSVSSTAWSSLQSKGWTLNEV
jgi:hypothetical protein